MMADDERARTLVRRAYERGRTKRALSTAVYALPMVAFATIVRGPGVAIVAAGAALFALVFVMAHRGGAFARAIGPGLLAALPPFGVPLVLRAMGHACAMGACCMTPECARLCLPACAIGGALGGVGIGWATMSEEKRPLAVLLGASAIAILAGALGCWFAGLSGVLGMAVATLGATVPVALVRAARA